MGQVGAARHPPSAGLAAAFPGAELAAVMTIEPIEHVPSDLEEDPLLAGASEALKAFELGRRIGGLGVQDGNFNRGYAQGLEVGFGLGRMDEDERRDTIDMALNGGGLGVAERPTKPVETHRAPRFHETWELHPSSPYSRGRRRRGGVR